jgi:SAM-dependent methyltransferase
MITDALRAHVARLQTSASALAALGAALDARASGGPMDPALARAVDDVVDALGAGEDLAAATAAELRPLLGEIRTFALANVRLLFAASRDPGWAPTEPALLEAAGDVSAAIPATLAATIAPQLTGLEARLSAPGAAFLDVGVGVGVLAVEMARRWPGLRVVGVDPWAPALALARDRVRAAGLADRIELREQAGEHLADQDAFDLAWIPGAFVPASALPAVLRRVRAALRPGGWLLLPFFRAVDDPLAGALVRLRAAMFGGAASPPAAIEALVGDAGFAEIRTLPAPPTALSGMTVGRRAG